MIKINIDHNTEMLEIMQDNELLFYGNFWDFDRPYGIIKLFQGLNLNFIVNEYAELGIKKEVYWK